MPISKTAIDNNFHGFERVFIFMTNTNKACTHKNAIGGSDLINVRRDIPSSKLHPCWWQQHIAALPDVFPQKFDDHVLELANVRGRRDAEINPS